MEGKNPFVKQYAQTLAQAFVTTIKQGQFYANESAAYEEIRENLADELAHTHATPGTPGFAILEEMREGLRIRGDAEAEALATELRRDNDEKFNLANGFVKSEMHEITELQAQLHLVQTGKKDLSDIFGTRKSGGNAELTDSANPYSTESELPDFTKFNERAYVAYSELLAPKPDDELVTMGKNLKDSMQAYSAEAERKSAEY
jgi:hypothetical protein